MKKILLTLFIIIVCVSAGSARSDFRACLPDWNFYYYQFGINGYPIYNALFDRYDFYDINDNYCGSLRYNPILEKWEYFGL